QKVTPGMGIIHNVLRSVEALGPCSSHNAGGVNCQAWPVLRSGSKVSPMSPNSAGQDQESEQDQEHEQERELGALILALAHAHNDARLCSFAADSANRERR